MNWTEWIKTTPPQQVADWWSTVSKNGRIKVLINLPTQPLGYSSGEAWVHSDVVHIPCSYADGGKKFLKYMPIEDITPYVLPDGVVSHLTLLRTRQWFEQLPAKYRDRAISQIQHDAIWHSLELALMSFADWEDTKEGLFFWQEAVEDIRNGDPYPLTSLSES